MVTLTCGRSKRTWALSEYHDLASHGTHRPPLLSIVYGKGEGGIRYINGGRGRERMRGKGEDEGGRGRGGMEGGEGMGG